MKLRELGNTGIKVSEIGLGCWQLGGDFGPIEATTVNAILETAQKQNITFWDTADVYGAGQSEAYIGECLKNHKTRPFVATKYGREGKTYPQGYSLNSMRDSARRSQDRLQCDSIDLLQLHCVPTKVVKRGEIFDWLRTIQQEGHIQYFGASVETIEEALICAQHDDLTSLQVIFNLFRQRLLEEVFPQALENTISIIVRLPLASGLLSGKYKQDSQFEATDHRSFNRNGECFSIGETFAGIPFKLGVSLVEDLKAWVPQQMTMANFAMRWILDYPAVTTVIAGASSANQVYDNSVVSSLPALNPQLHEQLSAFYKEKVDKHIRGAY